MKEFYEHKFPPEFIRNLRKFKDNVTSDQAEICKNYMKYRAKITFKLATDTIQVTVSSKRLSFFDQLSGFGNLSKDHSQYSIYVLRWNSRIVHWNEYSEHGGNNLLVH